MHAVFTCGGFLLGHFVGLVCLFFPFDSISLALWLVHLSAELEIKSFWGSAIFMSWRVRSNKIKKYKLRFIKERFTSVCVSLAD